MEESENKLMNCLTRIIKKYHFYLISLGFVFWGMGFIVNSSFIGIDGKRYFSLFDDAMISMRYAWNFSHGLGLVWNAGERVQGYTNLLMTLLMSVPTFVFDKSASVLVVQVSGIVVLLLIGYFSMKIIYLFSPGKDLQRLDAMGLLAFIGSLSYYPLTYWTLMGMETGLLALLLLGGVYYSLKFVNDRQPASLFLTSMFMGLAFTTRNESLIYALLIGLYVFLDYLRGNRIRGNINAYIMAIGIYAFFVLSQIGFQYWYYGTPFPNTYTLKLTGMPFQARILNGFGFVQPFLNNTIDLLLALLLADLLFDFQKKKALFLLIFVSSICYQVYVGGDPWHYWRMMAPTIPLLFILIINAFEDAVYLFSFAPSFKAYIHRNPIFPIKYTPAWLIFLMFGIVLIPLNWPYITQIAMIEKPFDSENNKIHVNTAMALNQLLTSDATVGVFWAGAIPYYVDVKAIDFLGKSDRYIAHLPPDMSGNIAWSGMTSVPGHNKYDLNYSIKKRRPTYIQGFQWGNQDLSKWVASKYVNVEYMGIHLMLLKDSKAVRWEKVYGP